MQACSHICTYPQNESTRASSCRCQAWLCRDLDVDRPLRSSQSFATIPTRLDDCLALISMARPCSSNTYTCTVRVGDRRHFCPLTYSNVVAGKSRPLKHHVQYSMSLTTRGATGIGPACMPCSGERTSSMARRKGSCIRECMRCNSFC